MKIGTLSVLTLAVLLAAPALADTVLVDEDFESYADISAVNSVWTISGANGRLVDETFTEFITLDDIDPQTVGARAFPEGGQGIEHQGLGVIQIDLAALNGGSPIVPSATQSVVVEGDIFDIGGFGNKRMSIGLRSNSPANLVELGQWNADPIGYAHRAQLFASPATSEQPNWQFYELPAALDRPDDADEIVTIGDIGEAWATYRAIITPDSVTYEFDLYRDGIINDGTDTPGVDASVTYTDLLVGTQGFDSLRIGSPSSVSSTGNGFYGGVIFDNLKLTLVDVEATLTGDYNGDLVVDAADYTVWRDSLGQSVTAGTGADGNGNGIVDGPGVGSDYDFWATNYGASSLSSAVAIPEPTAALLTLVGFAVVAARRG